MDSKAIIKSLTKTCIKALEEAVMYCVERRHAEVGLEHWLLALLRDPASDVAILIAKDEGYRELGPRMAAVLDRLPGAYAGKPTFSPCLLRCIADAQATHSTPHGHAKVRSGAVIAQLMSEPDRYGSAELIEEILMLEHDYDAYDDAALASAPEANEARFPPPDPPPRLPREDLEHTVAEGEDLLAIARRFAVDVEELARNNGMGIHDKLTVGAAIKVRALSRDIVPR